MVKIFLTIVILLSLQSFNNLNKDCKILFIGDSFTAGPHYSYSYIIKDSIPNVNIIAKSGKTTGWMLNNTPNKHYDMVYIWGGINDVFNLIPDSIILNNLQNIINKFSNVYIISGYDPIKFMRTENIHSRIILKDKYINFQKKLYTLKGCIILKPFNLQPPSHSDWTHPDYKQHCYISKIILDQIRHYESIL